MSAAPPASPVATSPLPRWPVGLASALLGVLLLAAYSNSFRVPFIFDDADSIALNPTLRQFSTALFPPRHSGITASGRPLLNLSFALNYKFGGESVFSYHAVNLAIHFFATLTLFGLLRRTMQQPVMREKFGAVATLAAFVVAALWALHPLQTESVTYIVQRAESLVGLFYLLTLYGFIRSVGVPASIRRRWLVVSVTACLLGMASKEVMISAPLVVLLFDRTFVSSSFRSAWTARRQFYLMLGSTWLLLIACIISSGGRGSSVGFESPVSVWHYALTQCYAIVHYLRLSLWPKPLVLDYGRYLVTSFREVVPQAALLLAVGAATLAALRKRLVLGFLGTAFFAILAPTSSIVPVISQTVAEHRFYLPLALFAALLVLGSMQWLGTRILWAWLAFVPLFGAFTYQRNHDYRSTVAIWTDTVEKRPENFRAWYCLGIELSPLGRFGEAKTAFEQALNLKPADPETLVGYANVFASTGDSSRAIELYRQALATMPREDPKNYEARHNLGLVLVSRGEFDEAIQQLRLATELKPSTADSHISLGNALAAGGHAAEAIAQFETALAADPNSIPARVHLANLFIALGQPIPALRHYHRAVELAPVDTRVRYALANLLLQNGQTAEAAREYEQLLQHTPDSIEAHHELGIAYAQLGRLDEARAQFNTVLRLKPDHDGARENLARLKITPR